MLTFHCKKKIIFPIRNKSSKYQQLQHKDPSLPDSCCTKKHMLEKFILDQEKNVSKLLDYSLTFTNQNL